MSTLLLRSAAGAPGRSIRHRSSLSWPVRPVVENQRLFSSARFPWEETQHNKHDGNFYILKHMKQLKENEMMLRLVLAITHENTNHVLDKHSRLLKEIELRDRKFARLKKLMMGTMISCGFFVSYYDREIQSALKN